VPSIVPPRGGVGTLGRVVLVLVVGGARKRVEMKVKMKVKMRVMRRRRWKTKGCHRHCC
tara:strand:+ start:630 stop:806 length:177 start_codon:yes stop_codon:yes gene_type:complete